MSEATDGTSPDGGPPSETFVIAQELLRLASSPWSSPTRESVEMAGEIYKAALKIRASPLYKSDTARDVESLKEELAAVKEELRVVKEQLHDAREEIARAVLGTNERLDHHRTSDISPVGQSYDSDTAAESFEEREPDLRELSSPEAQSVGSFSMEETTSGTVLAVEAATVGDFNHTSNDEPISVTAANGVFRHTQEPEPTATLIPARMSNQQGRPGRNEAAAEKISLDLVERKVKALLNKLAADNCESISGQLCGWVERSDAGADGSSLNLVIRLVFEKATDEPQWSHVYAQLCRKIMEKVSPTLQDGSSRNSAGDLLLGGQLFRKYLLSICQERFEQQTELGHDEEGMGMEPEMLSDEYYRVVKTKRQILGLVQLIGELYKIKMITERIIHGCIKKLLPEVDDVKETRVECLCKLLTTVGAVLDTPKAKLWMDMYFGRLRMVGDNENVPSRIRFMILVSHYRITLSLKELLSNNIRCGPGHHRTPPTTLE
ncbi:hypothetical protein FRB90_002161 [Tulasnella sp. 427]|nr:hypothetical protein FRB90_002161 [Tulasnella sp. 427]